MEAHINDIASIASRILLNPFLLTVPVVGLLALVTGFAARVATFTEDLHSRRTHLVHVDRQLIDVSGFSVVPAGVKEVVKRHPKVPRAAVIGMPDYGSGKAMNPFNRFHGKRARQSSWEGNGPSTQAHRVPAVAARREKTRNGGSAAGRHGKRRPMMLHHTALGNARMDELTNSARRTGEKGWLKPSTESARSRLRWRWARLVPLAPANGRIR